MYKKFYSEFLKYHENEVHFACHSHHYWPDVTRHAMLQYWEDSARLADDKWEYIFSKKLPAVNKLIAAELQLSRDDSLVFAPNTHELLYRLISSLYSEKPVKILCSDSEFHSFKRQVQRLEEAGLAIVKTVNCQPFDNFEERFISKATSGNFDLIFCSQVFFNSGCALRNLESFIQELTTLKAQIVIDGYHAFMALPVDLSHIEDRIFYLAGAYKYAQGGEGACFMHVPAGCDLKPVQTGWFADFSHLEKQQSTETSYSNGAQRFAGSTMDFSPLYRLESSLNFLRKQGLNADKIHLYIKYLQEAFLKEVDKAKHVDINRKNLLLRKDCEHGHFFTFQLSSAERAGELQKSLKTKGIITDCRGSCLRFGFALYHNSEDYRDFLE